MLIRYVALFVIICSACKTDILPCPHVKGPRLRSHSSWHLKKREVPEMDASTKKLKRDPYLFTRAQVLADKMDVEEWDCPKPGAQKKIVKEHKKLMEKRIKSAAKKRENAQFNPYSEETSRQGR